jgi:indolepyruvate ferredoxin oxidoreductase
MRGFGHVKERNVRAAQTRQAWLLHRLNPQRYAKPQGAAQGQFQGIQIRTV